MAQVNAPKYKYRYPGTNFFEEDQQEIFFGRQQESNELIHAIKAHDVFVIFANSGIGKTSLLNACLIPGLKKENYIPIRFRFQDTAISPLEEIRNNLEEFLVPGATMDADKKLWQLHKQCDFGDNVPLFIFDQFEEFFNHSKPERDKCIGEVADLVNNYLPSYIMKEMRKKFREQDPTPEELSYYSPINQRVLFLIRADRLNLVDDLSKDIPSILRNRFHLKPLTVEQAKEAILKPAGLPQNGFATPPIDLNDVYDQMSQYLKNDEQEVESFQLQILCQELEKRVITEYTALHAKNKLTPLPPKQLAKEETDALTITREELGGEEGMSNIVQNYYANRIESIGDEEFRKKAILLLEEELMIDKRRISLPETFLSNKGYPIQLLDYLVDNTRLIRVDRLKNQRYFEISHDRLLPPILASRQKRLDEDEKQKKITELENEKKAQEARARALLQEMEEEQRRNHALNEMKNAIEQKARRLKIYFRVMLVLSAVMIGVIIYANHLRVASKLGNVTDWINQEDYKMADSVLNYNSSTSGVNALLNLFYKKKYSQLRDEIQVKKQKKHLFDSLSYVADSLQKKNGQYLASAYHLYKDAATIGFTPADQTKRIPFKLESLMRQIDEAFTKYVDKAEAFYESESRFGDIKEKTDILDAFNVAKQLDSARWAYGTGNIDTTAIHFKKFRSLQQKLGL
jgi:hypothetical protein